MNSPNWNQLALIALLMGGLLAAHKLAPDAPELVKLMGEWAALLIAVFFAKNPMKSEE